MIGPKVLAATGTIDFGNGSDYAVSRFAIQIVIQATASIVVKGRLSGSGVAYAAIAYSDMADGTTKTAAITTSRLILVDASGIDVQLDTTITAGTVTAYAVPLAG